MTFYYAIDERNGIAYIFDILKSEQYKYAKKFERIEVVKTEKAMNFLERHYRVLPIVDYMESLETSSRDCFNSSITRDVEHSYGRNRFNNDTCYSSLYY